MNNEYGILRMEHLPVKVMPLSEVGGEGEGERERGNMEWWREGEREGERGWGREEEREGERKREKERERTLESLFAHSP